MDVLVAALSAVFIAECFDLWWPWRTGAATELAIILVSAVAFAVFYVRHDYVVMALAIAGASLILRHTYRLIRAWADRVEIANLLPIHRGNR